MHIGREGQLSPRFQTQQLKWAALREEGRFFCG